MKRRSALAGALVTVAGCLSGESGDPTPPAATTTPAESGVYVQSFRETMSMQGRATGGDFRFALLFTVPHTFWTVTGTGVSRTPGREADAVHLMAVVWDSDTGTVLPEVGLSAEITRDGETLFEGPLRRTLDPALDYHYGAAVPPLASGDELTVRIDTPSQTARHEGYETAFLRTGATTIEVP